MTRYAKVKLHLESVSPPMCLRVVDRAPDLILGFPFLQRFNPIIDWRAQTMTFMYRNVPHVVHAASNSSTTSPSAVTPPFCRSTSTTSLLNDPVLVDATADDLFELAQLAVVSRVELLDDITSVEASQPPPPHPAEVTALMLEFQDVFPASLPKGLPVARPTDHRIDLLPDTRPPAHRVYRMSPAEEVELKSQLDKYLEAGFIEPARSAYGAGVLFARKKDNTLRLCTDYRSLNKATVMDKYPMPRIDELLDEMQGSSFFSKMDLQQGFNQIRVVPKHVERTAFQTKFGSFQYLVMPFGLCNAPATFQRTMNIIFAKCRPFVAIYLDDLIIHSKTWPEHLQHLRRAFSVLREEKFYAKTSKCAFAQSEIDFCGFRLNAEGVTTQPEKIRAVRDWKAPTDPKGIRSFLGLCGFYQRFVPGYSTLVSPLTDLLKKTTQWSWEAPQKAAFEGLKDALAETCRQAYPDPAKPYVVHLDASAVALGATLSQEDANGLLRPITCTSRKFNHAECNYPAHEREMLAFVHAMKTWKHYLMGSFTTAYTDSTFLKYISTMKSPSPRVVRWLSDLALFHYELKHIPGSTNTAADALSRPDEATLCVLDLDLEASWEASYREDPVVYPLYFHPDENNTGAMLHPHEWHHGRFWLDDRIVVPRTKVTSVLEQYHDQLVAGHWGIPKTVEIIKRRFSFPRIRQNVLHHVRTCTACQAGKPNRLRAAGQVQAIYLPMRKWQSVSIDWICGLPEQRVADQVFNSLLVFTDRATKMVHIVPSNKNETAQQTAEFFLKYVVRYHGLPRSIHTDRDSRFMSSFWIALCDLLDVRVRPTTGFNPQCNGQAERSNQTVKQLFRIAKERGVNWLNVLEVAEIAINSAPISHTKYSPFFLNYGFDPCILPDVHNLHSSLNEQIETVHHFVSGMQSRWLAVRTLLRTLQAQATAQANRHQAPQAPFRVGQFVMVSMQIKQRKQLARKGTLGLKQAGPYRILQIIGPETYKLELPPGVRIHPNFNRRFLLPFHSRTEDDPPQGTESFQVDLDQPQAMPDTLANPRAEGEPSAEPPDPARVERLQLSREAEPPIQDPWFVPEVHLPAHSQHLPQLPQIVQEPDGSFYSNLTPHQLFSSPYFDRDGYLAAGHQPPQPIDVDADDVENTSPPQVWHFTPADLGMEPKDVTDGPEWPAHSRRRQHRRGH